MSFGCVCSDNDLLAFIGSVKRLVCWVFKKVVAVSFDSVSYLTNAVAAQERRQEREESASIGH